MSGLVIESPAVSPYKELLAYEYLYSTEVGSSRSKMKAFLDSHGRRPSIAAGSQISMFDTGETNHIERFLGGQIGSFDLLVEGTPQFPKKLDDAENSLPVFYYKGNVGLIEKKSISIVGTRNPSPKGRTAAGAVAHFAVQNEMVVVSGLAKGIDTEAMTTAVAEGGRVIGVIGTPINEYYPKENAGLQDLIARDHLLISQVPIYRYAHQPFQTRRFYFPERNITMAAISDATVIVEASETSGTRTQAKACIEQGRPLFILRAAVESTKWARKLVDSGDAIQLNSNKELSKLLELV